MSENADFALACDQAGVVFIGPPVHCLKRERARTHRRTRAALLLVASIEFRYRHCRWSSLSSSSSSSSPSPPLRNGQQDRSQNVCREHEVAATSALRAWLCAERRRRCGARSLGDDASRCDGCARARARARCAAQRSLQLDPKTTPRPRSCRAALRVNASRWARRCSSRRPTAAEAKARVASRGGGGGGGER